MKFFFHIVFAATAVLIGLATVALGGPSNQDLDQDLREIDAAIAEADAEAARYSGGLILAQIALRREVLKTTQAMLAQKRTSLLRGIDLQFSVDGQRRRLASLDELAAIVADLEKVERDIASATAEAERYGGGLIKAMHLSAAATASLTRATLKQRYYAAKHGLPLMLAGHEPQDDAAEPPTPGSVVDDRDAL